MREGRERTLRRSATSPGCSAPMPATRRPPSRTSSTARTSPRARPASRSPSICRPRPATTPTTSWPRGEVGKVGVPVSHLGDMRTLLDGIPLEQMNTSMTINATAAWLLALYVAVADEQGAPRDKLTGTIQNDIIKEYLSRGTYVFPPEPSLRLIKDTIVFSLRARCRSGTRPTSAPTTCRRRARRRCRSWPSRSPPRIAVLDTVKASGEVPPEEFGAVVGRISFFVNAGLRFITEICKMRAFTELWDEITRRALRRDRPEAPAVPLRRAGQLARPHRAAAGEQRLPHPASRCWP